MEFEIVYYELPDGEQPAHEYIDSLPEKFRAKVLRDVKVLEALGNQAREPLTKPLGNGLFELRSILGRDISRVLFFFYFNGRIVLTNGFIKKTEKTPQSEINIANEYRNDFLERVNNGTYNF